MLTGPGLLAWAGAGGVAAALAGLLARAAAARAGASSGPGAPPAPASLDGQLRAGFGRATAPWVAAAALSTLACALVVAVAGASPVALGALVLGAVGAASLARGEGRGAAWLVAAHAGAVACASCVGAALAAQGRVVAPGGAAAGDVALAAAWLPVALAALGALAAGLATVAARARVRPELGDEEGPALSRALLRPLVVAAVVVLVIAELGLALSRGRLDLQLVGAAPSAVRLAVAAGFVLALAGAAGAPWPLPARGERGAGLLRLGVGLRSAPALAALGVAALLLVGRSSGAWGLTLAAAALVALAPAPLGAATFLRRGPAPEVGRALARRCGALVGVAAAAALVAAGAALLAPVRPAPRPRALDDGATGPGLVAPPTQAERDP